MKRPNFKCITRRNFCNQGGICFYCAQPMWVDDLAKFIECHSLSPKCAKWFQATAEHVQARKDGGSDSADNIVAACAFCNMTRHKSTKPLSSIDYRKKVRKQMARGKWYRLRLQS